MSDVIAFDRLLALGAEKKEVLNICKEYYQKVGDKYGIDKEPKLPVQAFKVKNIELPPKSTPQ